MDQPSPTALPAAEIPESFFSSPSASAVLHKLGSPPPAAGSGMWQPQKAMYWYDSIIDWMFAHPGGSIKDCAKELGRSPVTIGLIARSDLFKARYAQRRAVFNLELDHRLVGKLAKVAEVALDSTIAALEKKGDTVPLPILNEIARGAMDRLGYAPSSAPAPTVQVNVQNTVQTSVSPEALARARGHLRTLQTIECVEDAARTPPLVAAQPVRPASPPASEGAGVVTEEVL